MSLHKTIITAKRSGFRINFRELIEYKDLFLILALRDFKVRYAQTALGFLWALVQPIFTLAIFILVFNKAAHIDVANVPYAVFALTGMLGWNYFSFVLNQAGSSLIGAQEMVKKIYFPRLIIPLSKAFVGFADYVVGLVLLIIVMLVYGVYPGVQILFLPLAFLVNVVTALGLGIWLSSLTIRYRDFQHIVPFMIQLGLYASPIAYPASLIPQKFQLLYHLNPVAGIVELYRYCFLATPIHDFTWVSILMGVILFITGLLYFKKVEDIVADII